jgi:hypothetical protein
VASERSGTRFGVVVQQAYGAVSVPRAQCVGLADGVVGDGLELEYRGLGVCAHDGQHERPGAAGWSSVGLQLPAVQQACGEVWQCTDPGATGLAEELAVPGDQRFRNFDTRADGTGHGAKARTARCPRSPGRRQRGLAGGLCVRGGIAIRVCAWD